MVKKFEYRGVPLQELESMQSEKWREMFNSRQRRSLKRGITDNKRKLIEEIKEAKAGKGRGAIKTHVRDLIVLPYMVGAKISVFSGKEFREITLVPEMIGRYVGEFVITNKRVNHGAPGVGASRSSLYVPLK